MSKNNGLERKEKKKRKGKDRKKERKEEGKKFNRKNSRIAFQKFIFSKLFLIFSSVDCVSRGHEVEIRPSFVRPSFVFRPCFFLVAKTCKYK